MSLEDIKKRWEAVPKGAPWENRESGDVRTNSGFWYVGNDDELEFIAHSYEDIRKLIAVAKGVKKLMPYCTWMPDDLRDAMIELEKE